MKPDSIMRTDVRFVAAGISLGDPVSEPVSAVSGGRRQAMAAAVLRCNQLAAALDAVRARMRRRRSSIHACTPGAVHGGLARMVMPSRSASGSLARARVRATVRCMRARAAMIHQKRIDFQDFTTQSRVHAPEPYRTDLYRRLPTHTYCELLRFCTFEIRQPLSPLI